MEKISAQECKNYPNELLRRERHLRGWSLKDIADRISCPDVRLIRRWESGEVFPGPTYRQKLCQLFEKNADELGMLQKCSSGLKGSFKDNQRQEMYLVESVPTSVESMQHSTTMDRKVLDMLISHDDAQDMVQKTMKDANRQRMLDRVRHIWIDGLLEHSLESMPLIPLSLYEDTGIVENPWRQTIQEVDAPVRTLRDSTSLSEIYDAAHGELLMLGAPGAGKTTLLLTLAGILLERARQDDIHPIPVIFHLASWSAKKQPLSLWLIEELVHKYQIPRPTSQMWVEQDKLLLLFDGLDEVERASYEDCIAAINRYREDYGLVPLVVCSRSPEYLSHHRCLRLESAVIIQPLSMHQIDAYLERGGERLAAIRRQFAGDVELQDLVKTPLMLNIVMRMYQGESTEQAICQHKERQQEALWQAYIQHMFQRRTSKQKYEKEQTLTWLCWLAKRMKRHGQLVLYPGSLPFFLRLFLWRRSAAPWNSTAFLDYAVERIFLQKVGDGYIFIHHLLLEYLASLDPSCYPSALNAG